MKKNILCIIIICLLFTSCGIVKQNDDLNDVEELDAKQNESDTIIKINSYGTQREIDSFEDTIFNSYLIIEANLKNIEPNIADFPGSKKAQTGLNYIYNDITVLKGQYSNSEIKVTISNDILDSFEEKNLSFHNISEKTYLILCRKYSVYWDEDMYIPYNYVLVEKNKDYIDIYSINGEKTNDAFRQSTFKSLINQAVEASKSQNTNVANWGVEFIDSNNINDILDFSDLIVEIETKEITVDGGNTIFAQCELINSYKGEFDITKTVIFLAKDFELNKKYLLFLSDQPGSYFLSSKSSCIPISDTETYEEYMKYIDK